MAYLSDTGFKQIFSHPELARELLCAAVPQTWARRIRLGAFQRIADSLIAPNGAHRYDDIVWCIHRGRRPCFYMFAEFQSEPDKTMATRMLAYAALLAEDLLKQPRATHGMEPLLLPVVVYSGRKPWPYHASVGEFRPEIPPGLESLQPELNYVLVGRSIESSVIRALLELDQADDRLTDLPKLLRALSDWLRRHPIDRLERALANWVVARLKDQFPEVELTPEMTLEGITMMFEHNFRTIREVVEYQAMERGREEGREKGREEGRVEGRMEALQDLIREMLSQRGVRLSPSALQKFKRADLATLNSWKHQLIANEVPPDLSA